MAFLVDFFTLILCQELFLARFAWGIYISTVAGFLTGLAANYFLSLLFVFTSVKDKAKGRDVRSFLLFGLIGLVGLGMTELGMYVGVALLAWNYRFMKILVTVIVLFWNYIGRKILVFR